MHLGHSTHSNKVAIIILVPFPSLECEAEESKPPPPQFHFAVRWTRLEVCLCRCNCGQLTSINLNPTSKNYYPYFSEEETAQAAELGSGEMGLNT